MNRIPFSLAALAVLAVCAQASAATNRPLDGKTPIGRPSTTTMAPAGGLPPPPPPPPPPAPATKLTSAKFSMAEVKVLEPVTMKFDGINLAAGKLCAGTVTWGDGTKYDNMLADNGFWKSITQTYSKAGTYTVTVTPKSYAGNPCISDAPITTTIKVNPPAALPPSTITQLVVSPMVNPLARLISTKWNGGGNPKAQCTYTLHYGDGTSKKTSVGPIQPGADEQHIYAPGTYSVIVTPSNPDYDSCSLGPNAGPKTFTVTP